MSEPGGREDWVRRMRQWGVRPSRSKGQNFLLDDEVVSGIAEAARAGDGVPLLEIGPGLGILTEELLARGADVTAIELDDTLASRLRDHFGDHPRFRLIDGDATVVDPTELFARDKPYRIVANLPYSVATVIIRHFLESGHPPEELVVMVQREVAERMTASAGDLSLLALAILLYTVPGYLFTVPKEAFHPVPKVTSAVVRLRVRAEQLLTARERDRLFELATVAFQQKRKTLSNSLAPEVGMDKPDFVKRLAAIGIDASLRPQALAFEDWLRLARLEVAEA
ncbi:MAG TPA: 16S rRNA (adenine(1518)-N(6)/adenine(1519)-N(6))-dimethyltransferase RsmA [Thermomicrobiales bacterium]|nr:16S rRNA (adenine(1518)-N(6)/adenine(1519)-N(6))-dimethyltransferase RsmA [Thermomicrobiales bacterium]